MNLLWCYEIQCILAWRKDGFAWKMLFLNYVGDLSVRKFSFYVLFWDLFKDHCTFGVLNTLAILADIWLLLSLFRGWKHVLECLCWAEGVRIFFLIIREHKLIETLLKFLHFLHLYLFPSIHFLEHSLVSNWAVDAFVLVALSADLRLLPKHIIKTIQLLKRIITLSCRLGLVGLTQ